MKKYLAYFLLMFMFIPFMVKAETCDTDKITIENITMENKTDNVEETTEATVVGKEIKLDLSMSEVGDNIEYTFVVKNASNRDYELNESNLNLSSDYITYSFETEDNSNIIKANSSKIVTLKVEYKNEVPEDKFDNGSYNEDKTMVVQLSKDEEEVNPKTGVQPITMILIIIIILSASVFLIIRRKQYAKLMVLIITVSVIVPLSVSALCKCEITVESKVLITSEEKKTACVMEGIVGEIHLLPFVENVTWDEYYELATDDIKQELDFLWSSHETERKTGIVTSKCILVEGKPNYECYNMAEFKQGPYTNEDFENSNFYGFVDLTDYILDSSKVCYTYID